MANMGGPDPRAFAAISDALRRKQLVLDRREERRHAKAVSHFGLAGSVVGGAVGSLVGGTAVGAALGSKLGEAVAGGSPKVTANDINVLARTVAGLRQADSIDETTTEDEELGADLGTTSGAKRPPAEVGDKAAETQEDIRGSATETGDQALLRRGGQRRANYYYRREEPDVITG